MTKSRKFLNIFLPILLGSLPVVCLILMILPYSYPPNHAWQFEYWADKRKEAQHQMQLWNDQKITKYKIGFTGDNCVRELMVENGVVTRTIKDCPGTSFSTITQLFVRINIELDEPHLCGPNGCECDGPYHIDAVYDEKYHFPKAGETASHPKEGWRYKKTNIFGFPNFFEIKFCTLLGYPFGESWEVYSFTPIQ